MMYPCKNCDGKSIIPRHMDHEEWECPDTALCCLLCPACIDMPWLQARMAGKWVTEQAIRIGWQSPTWYQPGGKFKPDPSCVLEWCSAHNAVWDDRDMSRCTSRYAGSPNTKACKRAWIEHPAVLKS